MKHLVWLAVCLALLAAVGSAAAEDMEETLSFAAAVELMYDNNTALHIAELNLEIAQIDYEKAMAANPHERFSAERDAGSPQFGAGQELLPYGQAEQLFGGFSGVHRCLSGAPTGGGPGP